MLRGVAIYFLVMCLNPAAALGIANVLHHVPPLMVAHGLPERAASFGLICLTIGVYVDLAAAFLGAAATFIRHRLWSPSSSASQGLCASWSLLKRFNVDLLNCSALAIVATVLGWAFFLLSGLLTEPTVANAAYGAGWVLWASLLLLWVWYPLVCGVEFVFGVPEVRTDSAVIRRLLRRLVPLTFLFDLRRLRRTRRLIRAKMTRYEAVARSDIKNVNAADVRVPKDAKQERTGP